MIIASGGWCAPSAPTEYRVDLRKYIYCATCDKNLVDRKGDVCRPCVRDEMVNRSISYARRHGGGDLEILADEVERLRDQVAYLQEQEQMW